MEEAFEITPELLRSHADALRALARRLLHDEDAAEDVLQDTWLVALRRPPARSDSVGGWLRTVTRSLALKRLRGEARRARREEHGARPEAVGAPEERLADEERARIFRTVSEAVFALEEPYRSTVLRRYFEGLPPRAIARSEGVPVSTVKSRLTRAFARLRGRLRSDLGRDGESWKQTLALCFGLPLSVAPAPAPPATQPPVPVVPLSLTALMATKTTLLALVGTLSLAAFFLWRVAHEPASAPVRPAGTESLTALAPAPLVPSSGTSTEAGHEVRQELPALREAGERVWPASVVPGPSVPYTLTGLVVDADDLPVGGAELFLGPLAQPLNRVARTDEAGRFEVRWLGRESTMELAFCARTDSGRVGLLQQLRLGGGVENTLRTVLAEAPAPPVLPSEGLASAAWTLSLVTEGEGEGVLHSGSAVFLLNASTTPLDSAPEALVDGQGRVHFVGLEDANTCPAAFYRPASVPRTMSLAVRAGGLRRSPELTSSSLALFTDATLELENSGDPFVQVSGLVLDARGEPQAGVRIARLGESGQAHESTLTGADGSFVLEELPPGEIRLRAGGGNHGRAQTAFTAAAGQELRWEPWLDRGREIRGRLVTNTGRGLSGWGVTAEAQDPARRWSDVTTTDERGFFALPNCPAQGMRLGFTRPDAEPPIPDHVAEDVWPDTAPAPFVVPEPELPRGGLRLTVVDAWGEPVESARVRVWSPATGYGTWVPRAANAGQDDRDEPGSFRLDGLPQGVYRVEVGSGRHGWLELENVWVPAGGRADLGTLAFAEAGTLAFELVADATVPLDDLAVEIWHEHADVRRRVRTLEGAAPRPLLLPAGPYLATARTRSGASTTPFVLDTAGSAALELQLRDAGPTLAPVAFDAARFAARLAELGDPATCTACHSGSELR